MSPPSFTLNVRALLTLPYRLCNPPPAAGNVRSCKVTPLIKISLDDVLNKRHLPPLTLKDFEEWLVFVEGCPQYLYFLLWLKEYETRYATWLADSGYASPPKSLASTSSLSSSATPRDLTDSSIALIPPSASLALFFTRAKQTFLDLDAPYALGHAALASLIRAPSTHSFSPSIPHFTTSPAPLIPEVLSSHPHPHPRELAPLASHARTALKARLERFATSACTNVGTRRAWCGIAGGVTITLLLGVLPALVALFFVKERWWRVLGWAGCWLGSTIVLASFHGICMMIYVFGDLRQLRSFELARPPISPPRAIARARPRLRSYFTSSPDESSGPVPGPSRGPGSDVKSPHLDHNLKVRIPVTTSAQNNEESVSETSTGTPVVNFDPGMNACVLSEETTLGIHIGTEIRGTDHAQHTTGDGDTGEDTGDEEECVIEISPAYYPEGFGPTASREAEGGLRATATMLQSVRSGAGRVMEWVRRVSGVGMGSLIEPVDHVGTFGVRREAGSLSERGQVDTEAGRAIQSEGEFWEKAEMAEVTEEAGWVRTAEFITREYGDGDGREAQDVEKPVAKEEPMEFDFDKLPSPVLAVSPAPPSRPVSAAIPSPPRAHSHSHTRSMSLPHISCPHAPSPGPPPAQALPPLPLTPLLTGMSLYSHPDAHVLPPSPSAPSLALSPFLALPPAPERQWWDTCPRHPAVAASLSATRASSPHSSAIHSRPHSHAYPLPIDPRSLASRSDPLSPSTNIPISPSTMASSNNDSDADSWRKRLAFVTRVPAFGPLTRVLSPVAARGQWEIVVRSAAVAAVGAWCFIGGLVALPEVGG